MCRANSASEMCCCTREMLQTKNWWQLIGAGVSLQVDCGTVWCLHCSLWTDTSYQSVDSWFYFSFGVCNYDVLQSDNCFCIMCNCNHSKLGHSWSFISQEAGDIVGYQGKWWWWLQILLFFLSRFCALHQNWWIVHLSCQWFCFLKSYNIDCVWCLPRLQSSIRR